MSMAPSGQYILLKRNARYWKNGIGGEVLPRLDSIRHDILANRETELLRFHRDELNFLDKLEPEAFEGLKKNIHSGALNVGPSLDSERRTCGRSPFASHPRLLKRRPATAYSFATLGRSRHEADVVGCSLVADRLPGAGCRRESRRSRQSGGYGPRRRRPGLNPR